MTDKDFCLSSYMAFRYIWKDDCDFYPGFCHTNPPPAGDRTPVASPEEMDAFIKGFIDRLYARYEKIGILLSGGMDSAILSSYLKPGSPAYTFGSPTGVFDVDRRRAEGYCKRLGLKLNTVEITREDFEKYTPIVMARKWAPVHSIEAQLYKAALMAKKDGVQLLLVGESSDLVFGGMDKLLSQDWPFDAFVKRYTFLEPSLVLNHPVDVNGIFERYRIGDHIDFIGFMDDVFAVESSGSYFNAFRTAEIPYADPYAQMVMAEPLDLTRVRNGEPKYLVRALYSLRFPDLSVPDKIPMPRPVDYLFKDWAGPRRPEFRKDIPMDQLTGNQKWQLWCAELFLTLFE